MSNFEFQFQINSEGIVKIPKKYIKFLPKSKNLKAYVILPDTSTSEENNWKELSRTNFLEGYDSKDSIYDKL